MLISGRIAKPTGMSSRAVKDMTAIMESCFGKQLRYLQSMFEPRALSSHSGTFSFATVHEVGWSFRAIILEGGSGDSDSILGDF